MALSFAGSRSARLQPAEKKRPSPLHSTSGWESRIFISHLVPDLPSPVTKNTGVPLSEGTGTPASLRAGASFLPTSLRCHALPSRRTTAYSATCDGMSSLAWCAVMWFPREQNSPGHPSSKPPAHPVTVLPVEVLLVTEPDQELPRLLFEDTPVLFREVVLPVPGHAFAVERRRIFFALAPAARELLEAGGLHALAGGLLARVSPQEPEQPPDLTDRLREEVLVAYLVVIVAEERRISHRPAHGRTPAPRYLRHVCAGEDALPGGPERVGVLTVSFALCDLLARELAATPLIGRVVPLVVYRGHRHVPAVPDYVHDLRIGADGGDLLYDARDGERAFVPDYPLPGLLQFLLHEVVDGVGHDVFEVRVLLPKGPRVVAQPPFELFGTGEGAVQGVGRALAEELALAPAEYLGVGVEQPHQPGSSRLRTSYQEERGYDIIRRAGRRRHAGGRPRSLRPDRSRISAFRRLRVPVSVASKAHLEVEESLYVPRCFEGRAVLEDRHPAFLLSRVVALSTYDALTKIRLLLGRRTRRFAATGSGTVPQTELGPSRRNVPRAHLDRLSPAVVRRFEKPLGGAGEALVVYSDEGFCRVYREAPAGWQGLRRRSRRGRGCFERGLHRDDLPRIRRQNLPRRVARLRGADPPLAQRAVHGRLDPAPRRR